jgi:hypothetical protein
MTRRIFSLICSGLFLLTCCTLSWAEEKSPSAPAATSNQKLLENQPLSDPPPNCKCPSQLNNGGWCCANYNSGKWYKTKPQGADCIDTNEECS